MWCCQDSRISEFNRLCLYNNINKVYSELCIKEKKKVISF